MCQAKDVLYLLFLVCRIDFLASAAVSRIFVQHSHVKKCKIDLCCLCIKLSTVCTFFSSQLFYKNGQPFPAHRPVGLRVNITHIELALDIPVTQEVLQEPESNVVKVAFTVRKAGRYEVAVKLGGLNVAYSPYYKIFQPGITSLCVLEPMQLLI